MPATDTTHQTDPDTWTRDDTWCTTRDGGQLAVGQYVLIMTPVSRDYHAGSGQVTRLLPGGAGDAPCVEVRDPLGRDIVVNAVNCWINCDHDAAAADAAAYLVRVLGPRDAERFAADSLARAGGDPS
jgi:hypothetical protein